MSSVAQNCGFYRNKRVLVTGVGGVKGSWLALELLDAGSSVIGVDIATPGRDSNFIASGLSQRIEFVRGDVTDAALMRSLLSDVDCVFHLAAVVLVGEARRDPLEAYRTNVLGTATVLDGFRLSKSAAYGVFVTTDKVYRDKHGQRWVETDPLFATGAYPVSKSCAEFIIADYYSQYLKSQLKKIAVARAGNVLLGGDFHSSKRHGGAGRIFVDCFEALFENRPPQIFRPDFTRPYTYGLDVLAGYMKLMNALDEDGHSGEAFNFGPNELDGIRNAELATRICEMWGTGITWTAGPLRDEPFRRQALSWEKSRSLLNWRPAYGFEEALAATVRWYKAWHLTGRSAGPGGMYETNQQLIREHQQAAMVRGTPVFTAA